ncbi:cyclic nucleotide-binding domain-containing protein [Chitinophaga sp. SYP-B3965]|uniref:Crp/Fnr family transcriptional regulator n=1 Tax=Chitinophaga sp. SYP-B3965 TaxID=2663120 RepID=UPI001299603A|nr:Crp/Fnr family transcriptional regulator [Chitinophaga sp. SYP-B3965]MRG45419.1 cyclic nucleotide-binding domain-containing protein [Chitinophaga sp. SYP-B3965]
MDVFFKKIETYTKLSAESRTAWEAILTAKTYKRGDNFVTEGQAPKKVAFVVKGLFSQNYVSDKGEVVIKTFFPEQRFAASVSAMLSKTPSMFTITALEDTSVLEYDFFAFKKLSEQYMDIATFYINYMELHWIIEKEPLEIALRHDPAGKRYAAFADKFPSLIKRLKKHHIASYLGITPTQLSRILLTNK